MTPATTSCGTGSGRRESVAMSEWTGMKRLRYGNRTLGSGNSAQATAANIIDAKLADSRRTDDFLSSALVTPLALGGSVHTCYHPSRRHLNSLLPCQPSNNLTIPHSPPVQGRIVPDTHTTTLPRSRRSILINQRIGTAATHFDAASILIVAAPQRKYLLLIYPNSLPRMSPV